MNLLSATPFLLVLSENLFGANGFANCTNDANHEDAHGKNASNKSNN
jgi:hypothetical protein